VVVSELSWLKAQAPDEVKEFFQSGYPDMRSVQGNIAVARNAGYDVLATHILPRHAWVDGYYDILRPRAKALLDHPDAAVRDFAAETVREINVFDVQKTATDVCSSYFNAPNFIRISVAARRHTNSYEVAENQTSK
jgi:hypothetical protein